MTGVCIGGGVQEGEGCRDAHRASEKYRITSNEMPATDKEACLVVAEVQTSGERVGFFVLFSFSVLFCLLFSQPHSSVFQHRLCVPVLRGHQASGPFASQHEAGTPSLAVLHAVGLPAVWFSRLGAHRWLESAIPEQPFGILPEASEQMVDFTCLPWRDYTDFIVTFLSRLLWGMKQSRCCESCRTQAILQSSLNPGRSAFTLHRPVS